MLSHGFGGSHLTAIQPGTFRALQETDRLPFADFVAGK